MSLLDAIAEKVAEVEKADEELRQLLNEHARNTCPFKAGDDITIRHYVHNGKRGFVQAVLGRINFRGDPEWHCCVIVLKKDGTASQNNVWITESDFKTANDS